MCCWWCNVFLGMSLFYFLEGIINKNLFNRCFLVIIVVFIFRFYGGYISVFYRFVIFLFCFLLIKFFKEILEFFWVYVLFGCNWYFGICIWCCVDCW